MQCKNHDVLSLLVSLPARPHPPISNLHLQQLPPDVATCRRILPLRVLPFRLSSYRTEESTIRCPSFEVAVVLACNVPIIQKINIRIACKAKPKGGIIHFQSRKLSFVTSCIVILQGQRVVHANNIPAQIETHNLAIIIERYNHLLMKSQSTQNCPLADGVLHDHQTNDLFQESESCRLFQETRRKVKAGKSRNITKFSLRMFRERLKDYQKLFQHQPQLYQALEQKVIAQREWEKLDPRSNCLGLAHLRELMGAMEGEAGVQAGLARLALSKMISRCLKEEVLQNKRCLKKLLHLSTLKLLQLRCMSPVLVSRMQIQ